MKINEFGDKTADNVLIQMVDGHDLKMIENEIAVIRQNTSKDFHLIAIEVNDWNSDLSPWAAPAVFGNRDFGGLASDTLEEVKKYCKDDSKTYYIGGYSLAGLFALWTAYQTDILRGVAAASPSVWFPGFSDYMKERTICTKAVYLSLGDKEEKTKNAVMATVGDRIREAEKLLEEQKVDCILEWNQGNHFKDADIRTARAFAWILSR